MKQGIFISVVLCFTFKGFAQQNTISVNATTDMRKVYFDYAQLKLEIIDQFGNVRNDASILSYDLQFKNNSFIGQFIAYIFALCGELDRLNEKINSMPSTAHLKLVIFQLFLHQQKAGINSGCLLR